MKTEINALEKKYPRIQSIMRFINEETLREAYKKQPDSDVKQMYGEHLDENISELLRRMKASSYFPQSQDRIRMTNTDMDREKYIFRAFEDRLLQCLFKEILDAIFKPKIHRKMADLKKKASAMRSRKLVIIAETVIEVDVAQVLRKIDQKSLVDFLKQSVADKVFIKYCERFLRNGVKLLGECADLESESVVRFISMMCSACGYYILQSLSSSTMENDFSGVMWEAYHDKNVELIFEKYIDCKMVYHQLDHEMKKVGINVFGDKICIIKPILNLKRRCRKVGSSPRNTVRIHRNRLDLKASKVK